MYPTGELNELAHRKVVLRTRIEVTRLTCAAYAAHAARPIGWFDRVATQWHRFSPMMKIVALSLGFMLRRKLHRRSSRRRVGAAGLLRLLTLGLSVARTFAGHRR